MESFNIGYLIHQEEQSRHGWIDVHIRLKLARFNTPTMMMLSFLDCLICYVGFARCLQLYMLSRDPMLLWFCFGLAGLGCF